METWFFIVVSLCIFALIRSILFRGKKLPPGPSLLSAYVLPLKSSPFNFEAILKNFKSKYGPFFNLPFGSHPSIFVSDHSLAHQILIQKGAFFSDRHIAFSQRNISTTSYGPTWRLLRWNLASEILHPSRIKSYSWARTRVLRILIDHLLQDKKEIKVADHFQSAVFSLSTLMCFGDKVNERKIDEINRIHRDTLMVMGSGRFTILTMFPKLGKILFRNTMKEYEKLVADIEEMLIPLIKSRIQASTSVGNDQITAYVDTLVNLRLPEDEEEKEETGNGGKLTYKEIVSMCSEFLYAGADSTLSALQWIMANIVKHPDIQSKIYDEIITVVGPPPPPVGMEPESAFINKDHLQKMQYLKAVVLEGLRRHPPSHFLPLAHRVTKEVEVEGYMIPEGSAINFFLAEMGWDPKVWDDPMEFKPERFLTNDNTIFDITGSKEIKMMPFGAGRRICPAYDFALFNLGYFVANLIWFFQWTVVDGYDVDLSEKAEFGVVMKNPLRAQICSRAENKTT